MRYQYAKGEGVEITRRRESRPLALVTLACDELSEKYSTLFVQTDEFR